MEENTQSQNRSLEMKNYKNIYQSNKSSSPFSTKIKNNQLPESNKENLDFNKQYLTSDNSQSAINPLSKSRENLDTSNNITHTNLFTAVEYNDIERVNELLKQDSSHINDLNEEGLSLLHIAVIKANTKMINLLLSYGANSNILSDKKKQTPLHLAYLNQNSLTEEIIKELIKYNAKDNIYDSKNKKPSDYMCSSYKKNKHKKFNINSNNDNSNIDYNNSDKKSYINNNTGNTVTVVTIDNHLDSFLTTNKEDEKSNQNNMNTNSNNNTIIQTPSKLEVDYDFNEILSINNSVEKSNNQNKDKNLNINNVEENKNREKKEQRRQYTFGKEEDYLKFQNKSSDLCIDINNICNNINNNNLDNIDINNNYLNNKNDNKINKDDDEEQQRSNSNQDTNINKENSDKLPMDNQLLNDSLEEGNNINEVENENENNYEEDEKEEENPELYDSLKNSNIINKDTNIQNSFNLNNNSLTYTESVNVNGSNFQSKNKISNNNAQNGSNNNTNENEEIDNVIEEITLKHPKNDKKIELETEKDKNEENQKHLNDNIDDAFLAKIITKKRDSFKKFHKNCNSSRASIYSINTNPIDYFRHSAYNNPFNLGENDIFNNSLKSNKSNRSNFLSPSNMNNKILGENKNSIKYLYKQKKRDSYNNLLNRNNSYKNSNTIIHNGNESRVGFSGDATQYSTQSQNNKMKNALNSKDKIKVLMNQNTSPNILNNNKITEFNCNDNMISYNYNSSNNLYNNNEMIGNSANLNYLKYWLNNIGLINYFSNFTNHDIFDINILVERMKSYQTKLRYETLESTLKIRTPGYVYRILCKLEADAGLIDPKIVKFMLREGINGDSKNNVIRSINNNDNNLNISMTESYYKCFNCCKLNQIKRQKKNDLKYFLLRYNLIHLYQNFYHNGFDMIEYVIIQMYSSFPINDDILENNFHIYDEKQRESTLKAIVAEMKIINRFMNSEEYNNNCDKNKVKYDNVFFEENNNKDKSKIYVKDSNNDSECILF